MDFSQIGFRIKQLRKSKGISQKELCKGICTQAQISKIEQGAQPHAKTLFLLAERLGVDCYYFVLPSKTIQKGA